MRSKLDIIEGRLRKFFESSVQLLPGGSRQQLLANKLLGALQESLISKDGRLSAPNIYTIFLHPDNIPFWTNRQELLDALAQVLRESADEAGLQFKEDPVIKLAGDISLPIEDFRVVASDPDAGGQTDVFAVEERIVREDAHTTNAYLILDGFQTYPLGGRVVNIGRRLGNHIVIDDPRVSRSHAQVRAVRGRYVLFDLNSTGGTFVNGQRVSQHSLKPGDVISLAGYTIIYGEDSPSSSDGDTRAFPTGKPGPK
jgi:hypothetical protein